MSSHTRRVLLHGALVVAFAPPVLAQPAPTDAPQVQAAAAPPYAAPFQLRPAAVGSVFRSDTVAAFYRDSAGSGTTLVTSLLAAYKLTPQLAPFARFAVHHDDPTTGATATGTSNALLGATWAPALPAPYKLGVIGAVTAPIGSGGGDAPEMAKAAANRAAIYARSGMDNAMFAVNDVALIAGASIAYVDHGLTVQAETTLFQLFRVRGSEAQPDKTKTNMTSGIAVGYFVAKQLSLGAELRYQRWLSTPKAVEADMTSTLRDTLTAAAGVRGHFKLEGKRWLRPALSYGRGVDDPMTNRNYQIVQLDVLFAY